MAAQAVPDVGQALEDRARSRAGPGFRSGPGRCSAPAFACMSPGMPTRSPHRRAARPAPAPARWRTSLRGGGKMRAEVRRWRQSRQIQTVCAASRSRSRTKRWLDDPAERRQSISVAESPCSKLPVLPGRTRRTRPPPAMCALRDRRRRARLHQARRKLGPRDPVRLLRAIVGVRVFRSMASRAVHLTITLRSRPIND